MKTKEVLAIGIVAMLVLGVGLAVATQSPIFKIKGEELIQGDSTDIPDRSINMSWNISACEVVALTGDTGSPLSPAEIEQAVQSKIEEFAKEQGYHSPIVYALPVETEDSVIVAYGLKILPDGSTDSITKRVGKNAKPEVIEKAHERLGEWIKEAVDKTVDMSRGRGWICEAHHEDDNCQDPYGNVYQSDDAWWLQNDGDSTREYFAISDDDDGGAYYRSEPGYDVYDSWYRSETGWIKHDWNKESALDPEIGQTEPPTTTGETTIGCSIGAQGVSMSYHSNIPDYEMIEHCYSNEERCEWEEVFNWDSNCAKGLPRNKLISFIN